MKKFIKLIISLILIIGIFIYLIQNDSNILSYNQQEIDKGIEIIKSKILNIVKQKNLNIKIIKKNDGNNENDKNDGNITDNIEYKSGNITYIDTNGKEFTGIGTITLHYRNKDITILDRNLGATTNDIDNPNSYGYYFQWGNNYGFSLDTGNIITENKQVNISRYGPSEYSNSTFIIGEYGERISIDSDDNSKKNLWGGGLDSQENKRGLTLNTNIKQRKGPCPTGYHIPSIGERNQLVEYRIDSYTGTRQNKECIFIDNKGFTKIPSDEFELCYNEEAISEFLNTFKLPQAGLLIYRNLYHSQFGVYLRTSTFSYNFLGTKTSIRPIWESTYANAMPIRCFADINN